MLILEDLYLGDVHPSERSFRRNSQYAKALDDLVKAGDALTDTLTEKQKAIFEDNFVMDDISYNVLPIPREIVPSHCGRDHTGKKGHQDGDPHKVPGFFQ